jgi:hypothetical protein
VENGLPLDGGVLGLLDRLALIHPTGAARSLAIAIEKPADLRRLTLTLIAIPPTLVAEAHERPPPCRVEG